MLDMILDCSCPESAKKSLSKIFNTTEEQLISAIRSVRLYDSDYQQHRDIIYSHICEIFGTPCGAVQITWFHGTRVEDECLFYKNGILPKSIVKCFLEPRLKELAEGLEHSGENPFSTSLFWKQGPHDEGPFAFLIKDVAIHAPEFTHSYLDTPEMVEDIAGILLGNNYVQLVNRFKEVTNPFIVSFTSESKGSELPYALRYLKLIEDGYNLIDAASAANACYCSDGKTIPPEKIQDVELMQIV